MENNIKVKFLEQSIQLNHNLRNAFDYKANFFLAISGLVMSLAIASNNKLTALFSSLAAIFSILAINYPFRKIAQNSNLCWWGIKNQNFKEYQETITKIKTENDLILEYEKEIHSLYQNSLKNKIFFIRIATVSLLGAFLVSLLSLL